MTQDKVQLIVERAREISGVRNARLISDNGPQFRAREFKSYIKLCGMDQTFTSPYYPQSNGKIERWHKELKKSCIRVKQPRDLDEAKRYISEFIEDYNYRRLHSAIAYVTPYDKLLSLDEDLVTCRKKKLERARQRRKLAWRKRSSQIALAKMA